MKLPVQEYFLKEKERIFGKHEYGYYSGLDKLINAIETEQYYGGEEEHYYGKAKFYNTHEAFIHELFQKDFMFLHELNSFSTDYFMNFLQIETQLLKSSEMSPKANKSDLILELCEKVGATSYISGPFGRFYLNNQSFLDKGISIEYHDYVHPTYKQAYNGFEPYMSILDLVINEGENSRNIFTNLLNF